MSQAANEHFDLVELVNDCPLGWHDDKLVVRRGATDRDVIAWLKRLYLSTGTTPPAESTPPTDPLSISFHALLCRVLLLPARPDDPEVAELREDVIRALRPV